MQAFADGDLQLFEAGGFSFGIGDFGFEGLMCGDTFVAEVLEILQAVVGLAGIGFAANLLEKISLSLTRILALWTGSVSRSNCDLY